MKAKWQPIVLVLPDGKRMECFCGAQATFLTIIRPNPEDDTRLESTAWCQSCYEQEHEIEEE